MNIVKINTERLQEEIDKIVDIEDDFTDLFDIIKRDTENLKEYWKTDTSENVFHDFNNFYTNLENVKNTLRTDIEFLENVVNANYVLEDDTTSNLVDEKIVEGGK
ncbi:MAG: hypothetical protein IJ568_07865 [Bacilli bacterium]|nr:hypothetical protein [Bacilli bacterium]